ncbi:MAG TPA: ribose-5-phosphate isomerase RpiA [Candidatus Sulfotelmatobacter sp.]|nr:ribose-5-phosphate isomerase RpiA [Candidatus Sulfotelmatobacter sp.]
MTASEQGKRAAGFMAVDRYVHDGTCIGLGTGSTAYWAVERVGERIAAGEKIRAVPTSRATEAQCARLNIPMLPFGACEMDVAIDGADEVAEDWSLIKGGGGALFREKAVALAARLFVVIVTPEKLVRRLGAFPTPVEVVPYSLSYVAHAIESVFGARVVERGTGGAQFLTDNGNAILDCTFREIEDPGSLDGELRGIHGVVATGLFSGLTDAVIVGDEHGVRELSK